MRPRVHDDGLVPALPKRDVGVDAELGADGVTRRGGGLEALWYRNMLDGKSDARSMSIIALDIDFQTEMARYNLYESLPVDLDPYDRENPVCTGDATIVMSAQLMERG